MPRPALPARKPSEHRLDHLVQAQPAGHVQFRREPAPRRRRRRRRPGPRRTRRPPAAARRRSASPPACAGTRPGRGSGGRAGRPGCSQTASPRRRPAMGSCRSRSRRPVPRPSPAAARRPGGRAAAPWVRPGSRPGSATSNHCHIPTRSMTGAVCAGRSGPISTASPRAASAAANRDSSSARSSSSGCPASHPVARLGQAQHARRRAHRVLLAGPARAQPPGGMPDRPGVQPASASRSPGAGTILVCRATGSGASGSPPCAAIMSR